MKQFDINKFKALVNEADTIAILSPDHPDQDSVSADLALARALEDQGKTVTLLAVNPLKDYLAWMPPRDLQFLPPTAHNTKADLVIMADFGGLAQYKELLDGREDLIKQTPTVVIDHHAMRDDFEGTLMLVDADYSATGELLYHLFLELGWQITPEIAGWMLVGIIGDTGRFLHLNTTPQVYEVAAELAKLGADSYALNRAQIQAGALSPDELRHLGKLLETVETDEPFVWRVITLSEQKATPRDPGYVDLVLDHIRYLKGYQAMFVLGEQADGTFRFTSRSEPGIDVSAVAKMLGGGGHTVAAGATVKDHTADQVVKKIVAALKKQLT